MCRVQGTVYRVQGTGYRVRGRIQGMVRIGPGRVHVWGGQVRYG